MHLHRAPGCSSGGKTLLLLPPLAATVGPPLRDLYHGPDWVAVPVGWLPCPVPRQPNPTS